MTGVIIFAMGPVSKTTLKASMLEYFRRIEETGEDLIVTDRSRPVLRISRIRPRLSAQELFGDVRNKVKYRGDILAPTTDEWSDL